MIIQLKRTKLQQQVNNDNTNKSTNNSNDSSDSLPYLNDGNVSVPKIIIVKVMN